MGAIYTLTKSLKLEVHECGECGATFAATEDFFDRRREDGKAFYCINGHQRVYRESELDRVKKALEKEKLKVQTAENELKWERSQKERAVRRERAKRGQLTRLQNRIAKGYCPCCKKNFQEVYDHIRTEHPEYADEYPQVMTRVKGLLAAQGVEREEVSENR